MSAGLLSSLNSSTSHNWASHHSLWNMASYCHSPPCTPSQPIHSFIHLFQKKFVTLLVKRGKHSKINKMVMQKQHLERSNMPNKKFACFLWLILKLDANVPEKHSESHNSVLRGWNRPVPWERKGDSLCKGQRSCVRHWKPGTLSHAMDNQCSSSKFIANAEQN